MEREREREGGKGGGERGKGKKGGGQGWLFKGGGGRKGVEKCCDGYDNEVSEVASIRRSGVLKGRERNNGIVDVAKKQRERRK